MNDDISYRREAAPLGLSAAAMAYAASFTEDERAQAVEALRWWFEHDTWTLREGLFLLVGIDPLRAEDLICGPDGVTTAPSPSWARITKRPGVTCDAAGVPSASGLVLDLWACQELWELLRRWHSNPAHSTDWSSRYAPPYFIEWARTKGRPPFWLEWVPLEFRPGMSETPATAASAAREPVAAVNEEGAVGEPGPEPLDTRAMARAFDGIWDRDARGWRLLLADCPCWAKPARVTQGKPGQAATWDLVRLALLLSETKRAAQGRLSKVFRESPELEHWRDAYRGAQSAFGDYGL